MGLKVFVDGNVVDESEAKISVFDHGLLYGDGVFEGIRAYNGKVFLCAEHLKRLYEGAHYLGMKIPYTQAEMEAAIYRTMEANGFADCYIRLVVTRGAGDLGLNPHNCKRPSVFIIVATIKLYPQEFYDNGLSIITVPTRQVHGESMNPRVKSLNYLNNIIAKMEAINSGVEEAIMLNQEGYVSECTGDNIFIVKDGTLKTPPPHAGLLEGCTRNVVIELAQEAGMAVSQTDMQRYDVYTAEECFLTGTAAEVISVVKVDGRVIGSGMPGPVTQDLLGRFRKRIAEG